MITHGMTQSPEFRVWQSMIQRCHNPMDHAYPRYGGRGITVCDRWRESFENFYADMGQRTSPKHSIERLNNSKGYELSNCCWADQRAQTRNRRSNRMVEINGELRPLIDVVNEFKLNYQTIYSRLSCGKTIAEAIAMGSTDHRYKIHPKKEGTK